LNVTSSFITHLILAENEGFESEFKYRPDRLVRTLIVFHLLIKG
jgi:hypothetical protein